jgi:hypothetical protein
VVNDWHFGRLSLIAVRVIDLSGDYLITLHDVSVCSLYSRFMSLTFREVVSNRSSGDRSFGRLSSHSVVT